MKKYFIRQAGFRYDDEGSYKVDGFGGIGHTFDNKEEAQKILKQLTLGKWRRAQPLAYSGYTAEEVEALDSFVRVNFGGELLLPLNEEGFRDVDFYFQLPNDITEEQAWEIRKISRVYHYELIEQRNDETSFFGLRQGRGMKNPNSLIYMEAFRVDSRNRFSERNKLPVFFPTEDEAFAHIRDIDICEYLVPEGIIGTFQELSNTPHILKSIVDKDRSIHYKEDTNRLILSNSWNYENLIIINSLLKEKFIEVVPIPVEEIVALGGDWIPSQ